MDTFKRIYLIVIFGSERQIIFGDFFNNIEAF